MHFLFCCEFYYPSVGGVQEVMRQLAERMVERGHQVTVATTQLCVEAFSEYNGVKIEHFAVTGNNVRGIHGEVERYRDFVVNFPGDAILIKAAQQWTFDALFPVLDHIKARKIFIPCGFSGLYEPAYKNYFEYLPEALAKFDGLIFYANHYRDIDFCRARALEKLTFIPNGASEREFHTMEGDPDFRKRIGIAEDAFVFSTVGSMTGVKGHREIAEAFLRMESNGRPLVLVLNGNQNMAPRAKAAKIDVGPSGHCLNFLRRAVNFLRREGAYRAARRVAGTILRYVKKSAGVAVESDILQELKRRAEMDPLKKVLILDLPRGEVIELFKTTDLFVFASNIEYSPLVLFEAAAAGTPFLTVPVGNAEEIASMTGAGQICPAERDGFGYTRVDPDMLAARMARMMNDPALLEKLGQAGRRNWEQKYTWDKIASCYEALLTGDPAPVHAHKLPLVSVVLPVFNGGRMLHAAVQSVLAQSMTDFELLVVDDGSTDQAVDVIRAIEDPRIRVIGDQHRRGLSARLNEGIHMANGRYIARMDADDIAFSQRFEKQANFLDANPEIDLIGARGVVFRMTGDRTDIIGLLPFAARHEEICAAPWRGFPMPHPTWMGRASWFRRFRYAMPEVGRAEDQELLLRSHEYSRFACLDEVLLGYRQGPYRLRRTLGARWRFLKAQEKFFITHRQWKAAALALVLGCLKVAVDLLAALPGCDKLFFVRMAAPVPEAVAQKLQHTKLAAEAAS